MRPGVLSFPLNDNIALAAACVSSAGAFTLVYPTPFVYTTELLPVPEEYKCGKLPEKAPLQVIVDDFRALKREHICAKQFFGI